MAVGDTGHIPEIYAIYAIIKNHHIKYFKGRLKLTDGTDAIIFLSYPQDTCRNVPVGLLDGSNNLVDGNIMSCHLLIVESYMQFIFSAAENEKRGDSPHPLKVLADVIFEKSHEILDGLFVIRFCFKHHPDDRRALCSCRFDDWFVGIFRVFGHFV